MDLDRSYFNSIRLNTHRGKYYDVEAVDRLLVDIRSRADSLNKEVIASRDKLAEANRKIGGWKEGFDPFYGAPVIFIVLADKSAFTHVYDGSLVMGNMMLAAHSLGLGSIWIHRAKEEFESEEWKKLLSDLGAEGDYEGIGHCAVGYIDGEMPAAAPRKPGRVYWVE